MMNNEPVIIIGAGPAGSATAITLASAGVPVTLIERQNFPRTKPGETLHPGIEPIFERLGVLQKILAANCIRHTGNHSVQPDGQQLFQAFGSAQEDWRGFQLPREQLDIVLRDAALKAGARIIQPCRKIELVVNEQGRPTGIHHDGSYLGCSYLIDASGQSHWLTRKLDIQWDYHSSKKYVAYGYVNTLTPAIQKIYLEPVFQTLASGWLWIALVGADKLAWVRLCEKYVDKSIPAQLHDCQSSGKIFSADVTWRIARKLSGDGWMLSGDAAAVLDPSSSHGVLKAIMSGMMCAHLLKAALTGLHQEREIASHYTDWLKSWFLSDVQQLRQNMTQ